MSEKRVRHALEYALFRVLAGVLGVVPEALAQRAGTLVGLFAGTVLRIRRADVDRHLALAFPDRDRRWRRRVARGSYAHLGREAVAILRLANMGAKDVVARTTIENFEILEAALTEGKGAVLVTGHLGNWEVAGALLAARGLPLVAITKGMANRRFGEDLQRTRTRLGIRVVDMAAAPREVLRSLRAGQVVAMLADQNAREHGVFVPFFGVPASAFRGPALFALRAGAPMFVGYCLREPGWPPRYRLHMTRVDFVPSGDMEADEARLTEIHTAALEEGVRMAPEQYFWHHKRWKTRPPQEPPGATPV